MLTPIESTPACTPSIEHPSCSLLPKLNVSVALITCNTNGLWGLLSVVSFLLWLHVSLSLVVGRSIDPFEFTTLPNRSIRYFTVDRTVFPILVVVDRLTTTIAQQVYHTTVPLHEDTMVSTTAEAAVATVFPCTSKCWL
jgi:hypothetical protein